MQQQQPQGQAASMDFDPQQPLINTEASAVGGYPGGLPDLSGDISLEPMLQTEHPVMDAWQMGGDTDL